MQSPENNLFSTLIYKYQPFWPLFLILFSVAFISTWGYINYFAIPSYEISASLIIKDEKKGVNDSKMAESIDAFTSNNIVENEIKVLYSRALMKYIVKELHLYAPVFEEGRFKSISAYTSSPIQVMAQYPNANEEADKIYFTFDKARSRIIIDNTEYPLNNWVETPYGVLKFVKNKKKDEKSKSTGPLYFSLIKPKKVIDQLLEQISIAAENKVSTVVNIKFYDQVPERGEDILNALIQAYNDVAIREKNKLAANTLEFVEDRIKLVVKELEELEDQVVKYKSAKGVVNLSEQGKLFLENVGNIDQEINKINLQLAVLQKVEQYVVSKNTAAGIVPSTLGISDPVLSELLQKLYNAEIEYQKLRNTTADNNPILLVLSKEIENIRPSILENIHNQRAALQVSRSNLTSTNNQYRSSLKSIPQQERELMEISRQQAIKNNAYSFLLQKREEAVLSYAPTAGDSRIVDMAESSSMPVAPVPLQLYCISVVSAFVIGVVFILTKEQLNSKVLFRSEIEAFVNAPIVAELSLVKRKKDAVFDEPSEVAIIEQFRKLRITMGLYGKDNKKKIMVTSNIPGEGKSFVSSNLAHNLASSGKSVVLLDFDLRNPSTSYQFEVYKRVGIIEYLLEEAQLEEILRETKFPNLSIISAGVAIGDHTNLILNGKFRDIFRFLEKRFDYILVDTPPIDLVSDAFVLSEHCDVTLLVTRHAHTPKKLIEDFSQNSLQKSLKNLAIVFNGVKARGFIKGQYGYGSGYGRTNLYEDKTYQSRKIRA